MEKNTECLLDVFIVTYNRANYLKIAIESVLNQTYSNFELTILDNCSTDNTEEVCKSFIDPRLHYIKRKKNIGGLGNIQDAFNRASKKYFVVFHDDDIMLPDFLDYEISYLETNKNVSAIACNILNINKNAELMLAIPHQVNFCNYPVKLYKGSELFEAYMNRSTFVFFPTVMYRTNFVRYHTLQLIPQAGPSSDILFFFEMLRNGGILAISQKPVELYRRHQEQGSQEFRVKMVCQLFDFLWKTPYYENLLIENQHGLKKKFRRYLFNELCLFCDNRIDVFELKSDVNAYEQIFRLNNYERKRTSILLRICESFPVIVKKSYRTTKSLKALLKGFK